MNVSACLVTRGDVDMRPVLDSLPEEWEVLVWDNSVGVFKRVLTHSLAKLVTGELPDLSVYGRYAAIEYASNDLIYVQDDDVIVKDPQAIVDQWISCDIASMGSFAPTDAQRNFVVCNMPQEFRHDFYADHALVGFGAAFHRDAPQRAFQRFRVGAWSGDPGSQGPWTWDGHFHRCCDVVFTALTPRVLVDVPIIHREFASDPGRMWTTPGHQQERQRMLDLAKRVR